MWRPGRDPGTKRGHEIATKEIPTEGRPSLTLIYGHWLLRCNRRTTLFTDVNDRGDRVWGVRGPAILSSPLFCKPDSALKQEATETKTGPVSGRSNRCLAEPYRSSRQRKNVGPCIRFFPQNIKVIEKRLKCLKADILKQYYF